MRFVLKAAFLMLLCLVYCPHESSAQANRGVGIPLESLPKELRDLTPRDYFIPSSQNKVGTIHRLEGNVIVVHGDAGKQAYFGMQGDPVYEKDTLVTPAQSKCRIRFLDQNVVTMAAETEFSVESFEDQKEEGRKSSFVRLLKGRAAVYAMRLFRYKDVRFTLATPTNAVGVRGTKFGVHVYLLDDRKTAALLPFQNQTRPYVAQAGALRSVTDCFCEEGVVDVDGQTVAAGQMFDGRTGQVIPTPPEAIRSFKQATEFKTEGKTPETEEETSSSTSPKSVTEGAAAGIGEIQEDISSTVQSQTGIPSPTPTAPRAPASTPTVPHSPSPTPAAPTGPAPPPGLGGY